MKKYNLINDLLGWFCFLVAAVTYLMTVEPTASFWDCPEFIAQGYNLGVGHPPGNPIFMLAARFFVNFAGGDVTHVALAVNCMSALLSAGTILLLFWTITHLTRRLLTHKGEEMTLSRTIVVMASGLCGALMYTWSDTFWFSAVEGEVYAFSSFCTALVFWLILKWENRADEPQSDRYLVLIAYVIGISIAVHLLNLLCIPAIVLVIYYRKYKETNLKGSLTALALSGIVVGLILYGLVPGFVEIAGYFELFCVNTLGMSFNMGVLLYAILFFGSTIWSVACLYRGAKRWIPVSFTTMAILSGILFIGHSMWIPVLLTAALIGYFFWAKTLPVRVLTVSALSIMVIFIGYASYALLLIRAEANPPMNQNSPDNVFALSSYLNREQYGERPLFMGQAFTSQRLVTMDDKGNYTYSMDPGATTYIKGLKANPSDPDRYVATEGTPVVHYTPTMLFPRMYSSSPGHPQAYMSWIGASEKDFDTVEATALVDKDGNEMRTLPMQMPTQMQNLRYFINYQLNHMYWRYFMWNFAGRQNDLQGNGESNRGNWVSGIPFIDNPRLGDQSLLPPDQGTENPGHNLFYMLPLLMGILGLVWQSMEGKRGIEQFWVVFFLFFMTGIAIVLYLNQPPNQPRERDYAFAGSFYAFAIWVGMGVAALWRIITHYSKDKSERMSTIAACVSAIVGIIVPLQVVSQTWDDHDRSGRYAARDFGRNYLESLDENAIIFTNGDNDTFPLWYNQEVEGTRRDVKVVNLSYLTTDWYANQQRIPSYSAEGIAMQADPSDYYNDRLQAVTFPEKVNKTPVDVTASLTDLYASTHTPQEYLSMKYPVVAIPSNINAAVKAGVIAPNEAPAADSTIIADLTKDASYATLSNILSLDMIATSAANGWNRPVYFAMTVPDDYYLGLSPYLRNTGLAYQVTPLRGATDANGYNMAIDTDKMYRNVTEKFAWGGLDKVPDGKKIYLDETVRRMVTTHRSALYDLAAALYNEGIVAEDSLGNKAYADKRFTMAANILDLIDTKLPERLSPYSIQMGERIGTLNALVGEALGNTALKERGLSILRSEILRYGRYLPYFRSLVENAGGVIAGGRSTHTLSRLNLSAADRYIPYYLTNLMQSYSEVGGDLTEVDKALQDEGIDINDIVPLTGYQQGGE